MTKIHKQITRDVLKRYLDFCAAGDVPDYAHSLYAYLRMDGYLSADTTIADLRAEVERLRKADDAEIERMAKAMYEFDWPKDTWERLGPGYHQDRYKGMIRAALNSKKGAEDA